MRTNRPIAPIYWWRHHFFSKNCKNDVTSRKMTSSCGIFTKISKNVSFHDIMLWWKYEVICPILTKVMSNFVFSTLIWKCIGKSYLPPIKIPYLHFYTWKLHQNRTECVKLNYIKSQKSQFLVIWVFIGGGVQRTPPTFVGLSIL